MYDFDFVIDGADLRDEDERNKSGRGRLASGTVSAPSATDALRQVLEALEGYSDELLRNVVRVQISRPVD